MVQIWGDCPLGVPSSQARFSGDYSILNQKVPEITELGFDTIFHIKAINLAQSGCVENGIGQVTVVSNIFNWGLWDRFLVEKEFGSFVQIP